MNLLAIDTATEKFSAALSSGSETWAFFADAGLRHSELLMDVIDMLMKKAALKPAELNGVLCMGGPGSFTGLRIGFSTAKGMALPLGIPFMPIPTLDCMARPFKQLSQIIIPVIDAKQGAFFYAMYKGGQRLCSDKDAVPADIAISINDALLLNSNNVQAQPLLTGPGATLLYEKLTLLPEYNLIKENIILGKDLYWGNAEILLQIAREDKIFSGKNSDFSSGPEYLRKSDAEKTSLYSEPRNFI